MPHMHSPIPERASFMPDSEILYFDGTPSRFRLRSKMNVSHCRYFCKRLRNRHFYPISRCFSTDVSNFATKSETYFSEENRRKVIDRLQQNSSSSIVIGDQRRNSNAIDTSKLRQAAVLVPLVDVDGVASILFTVRSHHLSMHRGEIR